MHRPPKSVVVVVSALMRGTKYWWPAATVKVHCGILAGQIRLEGPRMCQLLAFD